MATYSKTKAKGGIDTRVKNTVVRGGLDRRKTMSFKSGRGLILKRRFWTAGLGNGLLRALPICNASRKPTSDASRVSTLSQYGRGVGINR
jgi:hypothetical protein